MPHESLLLYDEYVNKIEVLAKALRIKIEWTPYPSDGAWLATRRMIKIDPDLSHVDTLATLLHELGHAVDDSVVLKKDMAIVGAAYGTIYTEFYSSKDVTLVVLSEIRAWNYGAALAKILGINVGKWYTKIRVKAIRDYKKLHKGATK